MGGSARSRRRVDRRGAHGARHRARLCAGLSDAARRRGLSRRDLRRADAARDGQARPARADDAGRIRRRRLGLCQLRVDRARIGARRFRLSLGDVGAVLPRHVSDLCLWQRSAAPQISAQARDRRADRLLRPDRARPWLRSRLDGDAGRESRRRLQAQRRQDLDLQCAGRRCRGGLGEARGRHSRLHRRARHQGVLDAQDRRQAFLARLHHRRDRAGGLRDPRGQSLAEREGPGRSVRLPQQRALRHRLGRHGRGRVLLAPRRANTCSTASSSTARSPPIS